MPTPYKQMSGRLGGLRSWANTADRTARTAPGRRAGPASIDYWLARLDPERFAAASGPQRLAAAEAARKAHYATLSLKSAQARRRGGNDAA